MRPYALPLDAGPQGLISDGQEPLHTHKTRWLEALPKLRTCQGEIAPHGGLSTFNQVALFGVACLHEEYALGVAELRRKLGLLLTQSTAQQDPLLWLQTIEGRLQYEGFALRHCHAAVLFLKSKKVLLLGGAHLQCAPAAQPLEASSPPDCCVRVFKLSHLEDVGLGLRTALGSQEARSSLHVRLADNLKTR